MSWKTVGGRDYLYRKRRDIWTSLGPRTPETEAAAVRFHDGRARLRERLTGLTTRLDAMAPASGLVGVLRKVDRSFEVLGRGSARAVNRDGYLVDLIMPAMKDRMAKPRRSRIGSEATDLEAVEIAGLGWLVNSPKAAATIIDARGYPLTMPVPDPRAFALHKLWLVGRDDREPLKRQRDRAQAGLVADLMTRRLPHLRFDDPALAALPRTLREQAAVLTTRSRDGVHEPTRLEPDW